MTGEPCTVDAANQGCEEAMHRYNNAVSDDERTRAADDYTRNQRALYKLLDEAKP